MSNNKNPYDLDGNQVRGKGTDNDVVRATVLDTLPNNHAVRVNPRGDNGPFVAPVLTPTYGMHTLPDEGERVTVLYIAENVPIVLGAVYLADGEAPPDVVDGDIVFGNGTGSGVRIRKDGSIIIETIGNKPVGIDVQTATIGLETPQTISNSMAWNKVEWDNIEDDNDNLVNIENHSITARYGGLYQVNSSVEFPNPGQNNRYDIGIFINDDLVKRNSQQSAVNIGNSLSVQTDILLNDGDVIDIRVRHDGDGGRDLNGSPVTDEFSINRTGRRRGEDRP